MAFGAKVKNKSGRKTLFPFAHFFSAETATPVPAPTIAAVPSNLNSAKAPRSLSPAEACYGIAKRWILLSTTNYTKLYCYSGVGAYSNRGRCRFTAILLVLTTGKSTKQQGTPAFNDGRGLGRAFVRSFSNAYCRGPATVLMRTRTRRAPYSL